MGKSAPARSTPRHRVIIGKGGPRDKRICRLGSSEAHNLWRTPGANACTLGDREDYLRTAVFFPETATGCGERPYRSRRYERGSRIQPRTNGNGAARRIVCCEASSSIRNPEECTISTVSTHPAGVIRNRRSAVPSRPSRRAASGYVLAFSIWSRIARSTSAAPDPPPKLVCPATSPVPPPAPFPAPGPEPDPLPPLPSPVPMPRLSNLPEPPIPFPTSETRYAPARSTVSVGGGALRPSPPARPPPLDGPAPEGARPPSRSTGVPNNVPSGTGEASGARRPGGDSGAGGASLGAGSSRIRAWTFWRILERAVLGLSGGTGTGEATAAGRDTPGDSTSRSLSIVGDGLVSGQIRRMAPNNPTWTKPEAVIHHGWSRAIP